MENKIIFNRIRELNNRTRSYRLFIDNEHYDYIMPSDDNKIVFVDSNEIELQLKIDWCSSKKLKINFSDNNEKKVEVYSSIPNNLWHIIVLGILISMGLFLTLKMNFFGIIAILFVLIPIYKISIDNGNYLKIKEIIK